MSNKEEKVYALHDEGINGYCIGTLDDIREYLFDNDRHAEDCDVYEISHQVELVTEIKVINVVEC